MSESLHITTNCKNIEHRPGRERLQEGEEFSCTHCARAGYFFRHDYRQVDYDTWKEAS